MNKIILIGNLTKPPELRATPQGVTVCNFDIAVNEKRNGQDNTLYFRVTAWRSLGESCAKYLAKGRKVFVAGPLSYRTYQGNDGSTRVQLEVTAEDIEFLSSRNDDQAAGAPAAPAAPAPAPAAPAPQSYIPVDDDSELPF